MQTEYKSLGRWLAKVVREICANEGIEFRTLSHDWLWELKKDGRVVRSLGYVFDLNYSAASSIGRDKVAAYELLNAYGIPAVPHHLARMHRGSFLDDGANWPEGIVVKPLTGQGGHDVRLFYNSQKGYDYMLGEKEVAWALSPLQDIEREIRVILLDGKALLAYAKRPVMLQGLKVFNLSKGAKPIDHVLTREQETLAKKTQDILGLRLSAVDLVELASGELKVLEVNSAITMEKYVGYSKEHEQKARKVYEEIIKAMFA